MDVGSDPVAVTGDLHIVQNNKLEKLQCKGPKYREPVSINSSNCKNDIKNSLTKIFSNSGNKKGVMKNVYKKLKNLKINLNLTRLHKCYGIQW